MQVLYERCAGLDVHKKTIIKLSSVASDTLGVSGVAIIEAIIRGQDDPEMLANLAKKRLRQRISVERMEALSRSDPTSRGRN